MFLKMINNLSASMLPKYIKVDQLANRGPLELKQAHIADTWYFWPITSGQKNTPYNVVIIPFTNDKLISTIVDCLGQVFFAFLVIAGFYFLSKS